MTEEPEIYDPNFIFFKRIFEAFKVRFRLGLPNFGQGVLVHGEVILLVLMPLGFAPFSIRAVGAAAGIHEVHRVRNAVQQPLL